MKKDFTKEFPILNKYTYLNTAASGLLSRSLRDWRGQLDESFMQEGSIFRETHKKHIESIRSTVARFLGVQKHETALVPNFSFGFNTLLEGLPKTQKVLLLENDYPSVNWPVAQRGFEVCYAKINEHLEQNVLDAIKAHRPTVFVFSIVQYINGIKMDLDFFKKIKDQNPEIVLIADATQYLGTENFNLGDSAIDIIGASTYKWVSAGYGNGLFIIKEEVQGKIFPNTIGFNSAEVFDSNPEDTLFIKHFEPGHHDTLNYGSLQKAIEMLEGIGLEYIAEKNKTLSQLAKHKFSEMGLLEDTVVKRQSHSTIFNLKANQDIFQKLREHGIICSLRGTGIRVSFHFYNTEEDLEKLISVLNS